MATNFGTTWEEFLEERRSRSRKQKVYHWLRHRLPHIVKYERKRPFKEIKWFWQRGRRGWADCDAWSMCDYLPDVIIGMLYNIRDNLHGHPISFDSPEKWKITLNLMIDGFVAAKEINDFKYTDCNDVVWQRFQRGMNLFKKYFFSLWD